MLAFGASGGGAAAWPVSAAGASAEGFATGGEGFAAGADGFAAATGTGGLGVAFSGRAAGVAAGRGFEIKIAGSARSAGFSGGVIA